MEKTSHGFMSTKKVLSEVELIEDTVWTIYNPLKLVKSIVMIPLLFQTNNWKRSEPLLINRFLEFSNLFPWIERIHQQVTENGMEEGIVIKAMFFLLKPHSSYSLVIPDNDTTDSLSLSHQYHWVIQSDPSVQFRVNNVSSHWSEGNIYELNNKMINEVYNDTDIPRIHFINKH